jgi:hypothetical protein
MRIFFYEHADCVGNICNLAPPKPWSEKAKIKINPI